jgi:hypothetical protein
MPNAAAMTLPISDLEYAVQIGGAIALDYMRNAMSTLDNRRGVSVALLSGSDVARMFVGLHSVFGDDAFTLARAAVIEPSPTRPGAFLVTFPGYTAL